MTALSILGEGSRSFDCERSRFRCQAQRSQKDEATRFHRIAQEETSLREKAMERLQRDMDRLSHQLEEEVRAERTPAAYASGTEVYREHHGMEDCET